jgi:hypothetical protein
LGKRQDLTQRCMYLGTDTFHRAAAWQAAFLLEVLAAG